MGNAFGRTVYMSNKKLARPEECLPSQVIGLFVMVAHPASKLRANFSPYRAYSPEVTAAILVFQTNPVGVGPLFM